MSPAAGQPSPSSTSPASLLAGALPRPLLLGVVHLSPLPGSPGYAGASMDDLAARAAADAETLAAAGFHGFIVENFGDAPFFASRVPAVTVAAMTAVLTTLRAALPRPAGLLVGVNVLRNDAEAALAVARATGAAFIRVNVHVGAAVTDQGVVTGRAAQTMRARAAWGGGVGVLADVDVKHASPLGARFDLGEAARETAYRGRADGLIVSGVATGGAVSLADLDVVRRAVPDRPLLVGSGATSESVESLLAHGADGVIVGTATKVDGDVTAPVDAVRARAFVEAAQAAAGPRLG